MNPIFKKDRSTTHFNIKSKVWYCIGKTKLSIGPSNT
jgi:hypothetical protein